ncbi:hypothetical protein CE91St6_44310 [Phocaeicola dorei]|uniref:Uncharacterized protein n=1 Tax=Phocaeicola dorei TaxID=357276 RepID=A0AA37NPP1_9BACT|nr:hypothetical protein CE91St6_44310 [Phocaeicola dorei]GKH83550.1 hypothetical protein CE91St7_44340 [Phocaeicola dorei]
MRTYRVSDGMELIADKEKWGGNLTVVQFESDTVKKSTGTHVCKKGCMCRAASWGVTPGCRDT